MVQLPFYSPNKSFFRFMRLRENLYVLCVNRGFLFFFFLLENTPEISCHVNGKLSKALRAEYIKILRGFCIASLMKLKV